MNILLDTHALIWFINGDNELPKKVKKIIEDIDNQCFISIGSIWEIAIKFSQNKLDLQISFEDIHQLLIDNDIEILPITFKHLQTLLPLPYYHRDPFDRIIIAQGIAENISIATKDELFKLYPVDLIWK